MLTGVIARYDVRGIVGVLRNEHPLINNKELSDWFTIHLIELYGINVIFPVTPEYYDKLIKASEWASKMCFATIKPPIFEYDQVPNFVCEVNLRIDDILTLHYS